jgi:outer membrane protein OmpA-like peptidoglycan-associated protein
MSQEKGSHLTLSAGVGPSGYNYKMNGVNFADPKCEIKIGGQAGIGYSYYFTKHVGISTGLGLSHYRTYGKLMGDFNYGNPMGDNYRYDKYFVLGNYTDNDPFDGHVTNYELRVLTQDWMEYQSGKFVEIPLILNLQKKFGEKENFGIYAAFGAKFQIPFGTKYTVVNGAHEGQSKLNVYGYYEDKNLPLGHYSDPDFSQHGFGKIHNPGEVLTNANGKLDFKFNVSLVGEAGFLISLSRRVDLSLGAFIDYGVTNVNRKKETTQMFTGPETDYVSGAENYNVGKGITYNSITKSEYVNKVKTISYGGKAGIRIKLGKLSKKDEPVVMPRECDTTFIYVIEKQPMDSIVNQVLNLLEETIQNTSKKTDTIINTIKMDTIIYITKTDTVINSINNYPESDINKLFYPIYFDLNKSTLKPEGMKDLNLKVEILKKYPEIRLRIFGNTCNLGNNTLNDKLGLDRAEAARIYLINKGIAADRLEVVTQSYFDPELPNTDELNRSHNRRCDFKPILSE